MIRLSAPHDSLHLKLWEKDERELYSTHPLDYYALHYRRRISAVRSILKRVHARCILELGSAQGNTALLSAESGAFSVALDINYSFLTYSRKKYEHGKIAWVQAGGDALPFTDATFDAVVLGELLEHCAWPERILATAAEKCSQGGYVVITTPNNDFKDAAELSFTDVSRDRSKIEQYQFGPDGDNHLFTFTMKELIKVVESSGLAVVKHCFLGSHFLHYKRLYHLRKQFPFLFNRVLECIVPGIPVIRKRYTDTLVLVAQKR